MRKAIAVTSLLFAISFQANALSIPQACSLLNQIRLEMSVTASNIANVSTTRTPEGGPYRVKTFSCEAGSCSIQSQQKIKMTYEPDHPDANGEGYVAYPDIDLKSEIAEMTQLTHDYEEAAQFCLSRSM